MPLPLPSEAEQKYTLISVIIAMFVYGVEFVIFIQCIRALQSGSHPKRGFPRWILLTYTTSMFLLGTGYILADTAFQVLAYTTHRDFSPGGPVQWTNVHYSSYMPLSTNICATLSGWGADGLLLYRCFVIYSSSFKRLRPVLIFPILLFIGEVIAGTLVLVQVSHASSVLWNIINFGLPWFSLATICNVTITVCIATPLLIHRRRLLQAFGPKSKYTQPYTSAAGILIESSALYAVVATVNIGFYASNHPASRMFSAILAQVQVIAPFLVILRVATRKSWTSTTEQELTVISSANGVHPSQHKSILSTKGASTAAQQGGPAEFVQFEVHTTTTVKHERSPSPAELSGMDTESKVDNEDYIPGGRVTPLHHHAGVA